MSRRRRWVDAVRLASIFVSTSMSVLVLIAICIFIVSRGWSTLSWDLIVSDYHPQNVIVIPESSDPGSYMRPASLPETDAFSAQYGFALRDTIDSRQVKQMLISYIDPDSPLQVPLHSLVQRIDYMSVSQQRKMAAGVLGGDQSVDATMQKLTGDSVGLLGIYYQTAGGGFRGSMFATFMLIGLTLVIALPIGIAAAIYLHELAPKNRLTALLRSLIEMLAGVPSIVFGLMGMTMLFSITSLVGIKTQSIVLGALTVAIMLFPVIIRQTEEALLVVPDGLRMASLSLGSTQTQMIMRVVLPNALPGILAATLLSISRIIGESAALIYTMGVAINDKPAIDRSATSLAVQIWTVMTGEQPNFELASAISIIILTMVLMMNLTVKTVSHGLRRKWRR